MTTTTVVISAALPTQNMKSGTAAARIIQTRSKSFF